MINQLPPVKDILGNKYEKGNIVTYRHKNSLNIGIVVKVNNKTFSVVSIPNITPSRRWCNISHVYVDMPLGKKYKSFADRLTNYKMYKTVIPAREGIIISFNQLMKAPEYNSPELGDILCHHMTQL